jgi:hypothetical protein
LVGVAGTFYSSYSLFIYSSFSFIFCRAKCFSRSIYYLCNLSSSFYFSSCIFWITLSLSDCANYSLSILNSSFSLFIYYCITFISSDSFVIYSWCIFNSSFSFCTFSNYCLTRRRWASEAFLFASCSWFFSSSSYKFHFYYFNYCSISNTFFSLSY